MDFFNSFYRLVGTVSDDEALVEQGESAGDVAVECLTYGCWAAQRYLIRQGLTGYWRKRAATALSFTGSDAADGGRYASLPTDFLMLAGDRKRSSIVKANGDTWGKEIREDESRLKGDYYYVKGGVLWIARTASLPPVSLYVDYIYALPAWTSGTSTVVFPTEGLPLIISEAAGYALSEAWFPGDDIAERRIQRRLDRDREQARQIARRSREPLQMRSGFSAPHWMV